MAGKEPSIEQRAFVGFLWASGATFAVQIISWLSTIVVLRLLTPPDYGLMMMAATFVTLLTTICEVGIGAIIIQSDKISESELRKLLGVLIMSSCLGWALSYIFSPFVASFYNEDGLISLIRVVSINFFLIALFIIPQSLFIREMEFRSKAQIDMISQFGASILTLLLAISGMGVWSLACGNLFLNLLKAVGFQFSRFSLMKPCFQFSSLGKRFQFGLTLTGDRLLYYAFTECDKIIAGRFLGNAILGFYSVALSVAAIPCEKVLPAVTQVTFATYSRIQNDLDRIQKNLLVTTRVVAALAFPLFFGMAQVAPEALPLLLGSKWLPIVIPFQLLCIIMPLKALSPIFPPAILAVGNAKTNLTNMAIQTCAMAVAFLLGIKWGLTGLCAAWAVCYPIVFVITMVRGLNALHIAPKSVLRQMVVPFIASSLMVLSLLIVREIGFALQPGSLFMISIVVGMILYLGFVRMLDKRSYLEIKYALRRR